MPTSDLGQDRFRVAAHTDAITMRVGKPGLDGQSNGAEQIAVAARDSGIEVVYEGIRLTPARIANAALDEKLKGSGFIRDHMSRFRLGRRLKMLVGKPGLDGHSNGAEQIAVAARDSGIEVVDEGGQY